MQHIECLNKFKTKNYKYTIGIEGESEFYNLLKPINIVKNFVYPEFNGFRQCVGYEIEPIKLFFNSELEYNSEKNILIEIIKKNSGQFKNPFTVFCKDYEEYSPYSYDSMCCRYSIYDKHNNLIHSSILSDCHLLMVKFDLKDEKIDKENDLLIESNLSVGEYTILL